MKNDFFYKTSYEVWIYVQITQMNWNLNHFSKQNQFAQGEGYPKTYYQMIKTTSKKC